MEAEVAFLLGCPLRGPGVSPDDVLEATDYLLPALEILDTRFAGRPSLVDSIADNGAAARVVLGGHKTRPDEVDLGGVLAIMTLNGESSSTRRPRRSLSILHTPWPGSQTPWPSGRCRLKPDTSFSPARGRVPSRSRRAMGSARR